MQLLWFIASPRLKKLAKFGKFGTDLVTMSTKEIKEEIQKSMDNVPDSVLQDILDFLKLAEKQPADRLSLTKNLRDILTEDKELLERLAK
jgi:hypothetical protein